MLNCEEFEKIDEIYPILIKEELFLKLIENLNNNAFITFIYCLVHASPETKMLYERTINRGELYGEYDRLLRDFQVSKATLLRRLDWLQKNGYIYVNRDKNGVLVKIQGYDDYQRSDID
ncbi:MAG: hypothetical protein RIN56_15175 [Sporomusaceae bacterium]|nr:hypothetical protein [Sporomusaceae bacterium]